MPMLYQRPDRPLVTTATPRLASWDKAGSKGQQDLGAWLAEIDDLSRKTGSHPGPLAVELMIRLPTRTPVTSGGRDLDNYLLPVVQRLGPDRVAAAFARKATGQCSYLAIGSATALPTDSPAVHTVTASGSVESTAWKQALHQSLHVAGHQQIRPGPAWLTVALTTGTGRVWTNLWKPLIDSLGPVLGQHETTPFHPHDDRIVDLRGL